ncbi:MAG: hypothetical protein KJ709_01455 [Nanoarchaeota archaeon]|nr:hypothetical protein [Nanoarchaeota archaeon]
MLIPLTSVYFVVAQSTPEGPGTFTEVSVSKRAANYPSARNVYAGNITWMQVNASTITQAWAGFLGNVTGVVTLDDSNNKTLYDWQIAKPRGEVYAVEDGVINWTTTNVLCWNYTVGHDAEEYLHYLEYQGGASSAKVAYVGLNISADDYDSVNNTFVNTRTHKNFYVGGQGILGDVAAKNVDANPARGCPAAYMYNSTSPSGSGRFNEVLLYSHSDAKPIYTAIIEDDYNSFDASTADFEMIVAENGHNGDVATTTYYFFVELS